MSDRLTQLEDAHRALAAQHVALMEFVRTILPLIPLPAEALQHALVEVYNRTNMHMDDVVMDAEYQAVVRKWLNILRDAASAGCKSAGLRGDNG